jgi:predicted DNA-binding transcriptional regulator AlpA
MARPEVTGKKHHLDKRADAIADDHSEGDPDDLLTTRELALWLGTTEQWCESGRLKGFGPPFVKLSSKLVRYRRSDILQWLRSRTQRATKKSA